MKGNVVWDFLTEIVVRLRSKSPAFFKVLQWVSVAVAVIPGIPTFLDYIGVVLPDFLVALENKTLAIVGVVATFIAGLPVDSKQVSTPVEITNAEGEEVKIRKVEQPVLPFTDKQEGK